MFARLLKFETPASVNFFCSSVFVITSFLLLALDVAALSQIVVLVLIHTSMIYVVGLFLVIGINLYIAKLHLFTTSRTSLYKYCYGSRWPCAGQPRHM